MNSLDRQLKELVQEELNQCFLEAQTILSAPATTEFSTNMHEIGVLRGYMKGVKEAYEICDEMQKKLTSTEKKDESARS